MGVLGWGPWVCQMGTKRGQRGQNGDRGDPGRPELGSAWRGIPRGWLGGPDFCPNPKSQSPALPGLWGGGGGAPTPPPGASEAAAGAVICGHKGAEAGPLPSKQAWGEAGGGGCRVAAPWGGTDPVPILGLAGGPPCATRVPGCLTPWGCPQGPHPLQGAPPSRVGVGQEEPEPKLSC